MTAKPSPVEFRREFQQTDTQKLVVAVTEYGSKDKLRVDVRIHFLPEGGEKWLPTRKGVQLSADIAEQVAQAIADAGDVAAGRAVPQY